MLIINDDHDNEVFIIRAWSVIQWLTANDWKHTSLQISCECTDNIREREMSLSWIAYPRRSCIIVDLISHTIRIYKCLFTHVLRNTHVYLNQILSINDDKDASLYLCISSCRKMFSQGSWYCDKKGSRFKHGKPFPWWRHWMEKKSCYWPFVQRIHRSMVNSPHKGQWRGSLILSKQWWGWRFGRL